MARFCNVVGYSEDQVENPPLSGIYKDQIVEITYRGDVLRNARGMEPGVGVNTDVTVSARISIVADQYAFEHFFNIKYVMWEGVRWAVSQVDATQRPRLILTLGSVYNGPTP